MNFGFCLEESSTGTRICGRVGAIKQPDFGFTPGGVSKNACITLHGLAVLAWRTATICAQGGSAAMSVFVPPGGVEMVIIT